MPVLEVTHQSLAFWREISQNLLEGKTKYLKQLSKYIFLEAYEQQTLALLAYLEEKVK